MGHVLLLQWSLISAAAAVPVSAWSRFERPIRAQSASQQWELRVEHLLTMSVEEAHGELAIRDFVPEKMAWLERDRDQLKGCLVNRTLLSKAGHSPRGHGTETSVLAGLVQFHGRHQRLWAVNGQIPGPTLVLAHGAEVQIRLQNRLLLDSLSVHLHGIQLQDRWFLDGVAPMQQCPLAVRSDFNFRFRAEPAGTHWYHGHFPNGHQSNGFAGALVVLPEQGVQEDRDYVALLQDWPWVGTEEQEQADREGTARWATGAHGEFDPPEGNGQIGEEDGVWAILVNQKGWHDRAQIVSQTDRIPWTRFAVGKDEQVRLRLIHGGFSHPLVVHIEGHTVEVIAADGTEVEPRRVDALILFPGERFDVRLHSLKQPKRSVYRMVVGLAEQFLSTNGTVQRQIYGLAELDYGEAAAGNGGGEKRQTAVDFRLASRCAARKCALLGCPFMANNSTFEAGDGRKFGCISVDQLITMRAVRNGTSMRDDGPAIVMEKHVVAVDPLAHTVDGFQFQMANSSLGPLFLAGSQRALEAGGNNCSQCVEKPCKCFIHKRFAMGRDVQITFVNLEQQRSVQTSPPGGRQRPAAASQFVDLFRHSLAIHVHGTRFAVLRMGFPLANSATGKVEPNAELVKCLSAAGQCDKFAETPSDGGLMRKLEKDTVLVPFGGYTVIRFRADNPGWWLAEAQQSGQGTVKFAFSVGTTDEAMPKPPKDFRSDCGTFEPGADIYSQFHDYP